MIEISNGVIYGLFALFLIIGVLLGLKRGLIKSTIRIITVIISCVLVVFVTEPITGAILSADLSSAGLVIGEIPVTTINETIVAYVSQINIISGLLSSSPTLVALINAIPTILVNLILFFILFFLIKGILYFIDIIINRIVIKKDSNKPKRRLWGAIVGGVQGIICFLFVLIPIAGTMNLINDTLDVIDEQNAQITTTTSINQISLSSTNSNTEESVPVGEFDEIARDGISAYNDIFIIKMFNAIGYKQVTNAVYDKITTIEVNNEQKTNLRNETIVVAKLVVGYDKLKGVNLNEFSQKDADNANKLIDDAFSSPIIGGVVTELTTGLANTWTNANPSSFAGMEKPVFDENLVETFDSLLLNLRTNTQADLQKDLKVIVMTIKVASDYDVVESVNTGDVDTIVATLGKEGCMENLIGVLSSGKATKQIIPSFMEYGLNYGYNAVGLEDLSVNITKTADQVNWETEQVVLGNLFEGISGTYLSSKAEGEVLEKVDFIAFAKVMNSLRDSQLLKDCSQEISIHLLNSELLAGVDTTTLVSYIENDTKYQEMDFAVMFSTLKSSANIANDLKDITSGTGEVTGLDKNDVSGLINGLTSEGPTKEVLKDLASAENLEKSGVDSSTAGAVNGIVESITEYDTTADDAVAVPETDEEIENATGAVEELLTASKNAQDANVAYVFGNNETEAKAKMTTFIENMLSSEFIFAATINRGEELGFTSGGVSNLSADEKVWMGEVIAEQKTTNPKATNQKCEQLKDMFGI